MVGCSIKGCKNRSKRGSRKSIKFFAFPKDINYIKKWKKACQNVDINPKTARICSSHFKASSFKRKSKYYVPKKAQSLLPNAIPTENLFYEEPESTDANQIDSEEEIQQSFSAQIQCEVKGCGNNNKTCDPTLEFFPLPKHPIPEEWKIRCGLLDDSSNIKERYICSVHFEEESFITALSTVDSVQVISRTLRDGAKPTLFLPNPHFTTDTNMDVITSDSDEDSVPFLPKDNEPGLIELINENEALNKQIKELQATVTTKKTQLEKKKQDLKKLEQEGTSILRKSNIQQKTILSKVFSKAQIKLLSGKKTYWSNHDMAVGFTLCHLSNRRCYHYLMKNLHIPLPGYSSLKKWVNKNSVVNGDNVKEDGKDLSD